MPFADQDLARRVEEAWVRLGVENAQAQARLDPESGAMALPVGGGYAVFMGVGSPLSQVQGVGLYGPVGDAELERMESFYRERGAPIQMELASLADSSLLGLLSRRGYRAVEQTHVLVRPLGSREPADEVPSPREKGPVRRGRGRGRGRADPAGRGGDLGRVGAPLLLRRAGRAAPPAPGRRHRDGLHPHGELLAGARRRAHRRGRRW